MECIKCGGKIEQDWAEEPPHPQCFGCNQAQQNFMENMY